MSLWQTEDVARITFFFTDEDDATGETRISIPVASFDRAIDYGKQLAIFLNAVSSCALVKFHVVSKGYDSDLTAVASTPADLSQRGVFVYQTADSTLAVLKAVSLHPDLILATGPYADVGIDVAQLAVAALVSASIEGIEGVEPCDEWGADLVQLLAAYRGYEGPR